MNRLLSFFLVFLPTTPVWSMGRAPDGSGAQTPATPYSGLLAMVPWLMIFGVFYFLLIRPQQKQAKSHQEMLDALKRGDNIVTQGGFYGVVSNIKGAVVEIKLNDEVKVRVDKAAIARVLREENDSAKSPATV